MTPNDLANAVLMDQDAMRAANLLMEHLPMVIAALRAGRLNEDEVRSLLHDANEELCEVLNDSAHMGNIDQLQKRIDAWFERMNAQSLPQLERP